MNHGIELLYQAFAVLMFCFAVTLLFTAYRNFNTIYNISKGIKEDQIIYEQSQVITQPVVSKGEIITMLLTPLEYDIEIDGFLICKNENTKECVNSYPISGSSFIKIYEYDSNGNITKIIFKRSEEGLSLLQGKFLTV
jgi:hypothetical protein